MSPSKISDLRSFISPSPLPIKSHQGLKITARSENHYDCAVPSRQEVAQQNYVRRTKQLTEEGYQAPNYKPYQLLGEPLILEDRHLILYALGQLNEKNVDELASNKKEDTAQKVKEEKTPKDDASDVPPPKKFIIRRSTKSQKSLGKEVVYGRKMVNLAKLGHGFFTLIKQEEEARKTVQLKEQRELEEKKKCEWQPAVVDSSDEEEFDPDLGRDEALSPYMNNEEKRSSESFGINSSETSGKESTLQVPSTNSMSMLPSPSPSFGPAPARKRRKKKRPQESVRPYTPCRSNINIEIEEEDSPDMHVLFRQLCALNWILEAMMTEPPLAMDSITKCWNIKYRELRQNTFCKTSQQKLRKEKHLENKWNMFITHPGAGHLHENTLGLPNAQRGRQRMSLSRQMRKMSVQTQQGGVGQSAPSQQSFITSSMTFPAEQTTSRMDEDRMSSARDSVRGGGGVGVVDWDSISQTRTEDGEMKTMASRAERSASVASERSIITRDLSSAEMRKYSKRRTTLSKEQLEERDVEDEAAEEQVSSWVETTNQKLSSSSCDDERPLSADVRPRKKPFKPLFPSKRLVHMNERLRNKFADVKEDNALELHDKLEALEKKKYVRVEKKFNSIDCKKNRHISLQLTEFREVGKDKEETAEEKKKKKKLEDESKWFQELVRLLPDSIWSDRQCAAMMDKLQSMGQIESRKITPQKFLNVLTSLKHWELCAPDVRAAVEFVREKVVGMSVEEFEAWYRIEIEDLNRSRSAPPMTS
ncbi:coiled-coil domain-containing protein 60-like isoform X1 [Apostichopus japonicus]|uniref:coiled-coil domain-containing protein 60-like isoform X1 n=1 Tax=Stichopus japonicus TaxID=307972 RepID=UPI003AB6FEB9